MILILAIAGGCLLGGGIGLAMYEVYRNRRAPQLPEPQQILAQVVQPSTLAHGAPMTHAPKKHSPPEHSPTQYIPTQKEIDEVNKAYGHLPWEVRPLKMSPVIEGFDYESLAYIGNDYQERLWPPRAAQAEPWSVAGAQRKRLGGG